MSSRATWTIAFLLLPFAARVGAETPEAADQRRKALVHYRAGQEAVASENLDKAETEFRTAIQLDPFLVLAHYELGRVFMSTRRYPDAVATFLRCREAFHGEDARRLGNDSAYEDRLQSQIRTLEDTVKQLQARGPTTQTANVQSAIRRLETNVEELKRRRRRRDRGAAPTPPGISLALGSAYFRTGALGEAEREYLAVLEVDPKLGEAHNNLAVVYLLTGRPREAQEALRLAQKHGFTVDPQLQQDVKKQLPSS